VAHDPRAEVAAGVQQAPILVVVKVGALAARDHPGVLAGEALLERCEIGEEMSYVTLRHSPRGRPVEARGVHCASSG
jgi:hypothetical protein